jgi:hypothetical protein
MQIMKRILIFGGFAISAVAVYISTSGLFDSVGKTLALSSASPAFGNSVDLPLPGPADQLRTLILENCYPGRTVVLSDAALDAFMDRALGIVKIGGSLTLADVNTLMGSLSPSESSRYLDKCMMSLIVFYNEYPSEWDEIERRSDGDGDLTNIANTFDAQKD